MNKKLKISLFILLLLSCLASRGFSYETFDGRYHYNQNNQMLDDSYYAEMRNEEILLIVDFSQSMSKQLGMTSRYVQALTSINHILSVIPPETKIGLRVFGITNNIKIVINSSGVPMGNGKISELCTSSRLVVPINPHNNSKIADTLSTYKPTGATPIGYSLRQAIQNDFSISPSVKHVILVTDGGENCGDDPCRYIKKVMMTRNDILIDVIGITVDQNAYSQLYCIANNANGSYYNISSPDDLDTSLKTIFSKITSSNPMSAQVKTDINYAGGFAPAPVIKPQTPNFNEYTAPPPVKVPKIKYTNYSFEFDI